MRSGRDAGGADKAVCRRRSGRVPPAQSLSRLGRATPGGAGKRSPGSCEKISRRGGCQPAGRADLRQLWIDVRRRARLVIGFDGRGNGCRGVVPRRLWRWLRRRPLAAVVAYENRTARGARQVVAAPAQIAKREAPRYGPEKGGVPASSTVRAASMARIRTILAMNKDSLRSGSAAGSQAQAQAFGFDSSPV